MRADSAHGVCLEEKVSLGHLNGPEKLLALSAIVDLLDWDVVLLAPGHADTRVNVVELRCAQRNCLVLLLCRAVDFLLVQTGLAACQLVLCRLNLLLAVDC